MGANKTVPMNGADIIVDFLVRQRVPYLFGLCGHGITGFLDAAFKAQNRIRTISVHHEQAAGHMADAYFKVRHEPVATFTSCGPGSANLVVALAAAMMDSSAFFAITGNVPTGQFNRMPFQETGRFYQGDYPSVIRPYVKRSYQPTRVDMLPLAVRQAWDLMLSGRPGPVNLDVPLNVFVEEDSVVPPSVAPRVVNGTPGNTAALAAALDLLLNARQPVIVAGQGILLAEAAPELKTFAERMNLPVVTSPNGKGAISDRHPLAFGAIGRNGSYAANDATKNADVILALGFSFDDRATSAWLDGYTL
jgi:acetolactate synthase-1/2/3 large subunit